jgi:hypothetical protein
VPPGYVQLLSGHMLCKSPVTRERLNCTHMPSRTEAAQNLPLMQRRWAASSCRPVRMVRQQTQVLCGHCTRVSPPWRGCRCWPASHGWAHGGLLEAGCRGTHAWGGGGPVEGAWGSRWTPQWHAWGACWDTCRRDSKGCSKGEHSDQNLPARRTDNPQCEKPATHNSCQMQGLQARSIC